MKVECNNAITGNNMHELRRLMAERTNGLIFKHKHTHIFYYKAEAHNIHFKIVIPGNKH